MLYSGHIKRTYDFLAKTNEVNSMDKDPKYINVDSSALPEIFRKVAEAKRMLETGETDKVNVATKAVGISRSAFYKYRDCISPFQNMMAGRIITFQMVLKDKAGVLSSI